MLTLSQLDNGHVIIQFVVSEPKVAPLGFAGNRLAVNAKQEAMALPLQTMYLPRVSIHGIKGSCVVDGPLDALKGIYCTAKAELETQLLVYYVQAHATGAGRSVHVP